MHIGFRVFFPLAWRGPLARSDIGHIQDLGFRVAVNQRATTWEFPKIGEPNIVP